MVDVDPKSAEGNSALLQEFVSGYAGSSCINNGTDRKTDLGLFVFSFSHENSYTTDTASLVLSGTANTTLGLLKEVHLIAALCRRSAALLTDVISRLTFR